MASRRARLQASAALIVALFGVNRVAALQDPEYHRYAMFGAADRALAKGLGRDLHVHESQSRLPTPQLQMVRRIERAIADRNGDVIVLRTARQTGKNELEAFAESRALSAFRAIPGSVWVRTAPTWKPQIVNSRLRLEKHLKADPLLAGRWRKLEGFIYENDHAQVHFLSGGPTANVVGATASIALSVDEAHKIDRGKFEEDFVPFTASTNAPTILWGVAAAKLDLLYEYREKAIGTDRVLEFPASVWCELSPAYRGHYEARVKTLGADHPVILTQYDLVDVEAIGGYLNDAQRESLLSSKNAHPRLDGPRDGMAYGLVVDVGGQAEQQMDDEELRLEQPTRDSTVGLVLEWDPNEATPSLSYPTVRIVNAYWWTGRDHLTAAGELVRLASHWHISHGAIDARGLGEAQAMHLHREVPCIEAYTASSADVSADCYDLLARLNQGKVRMWRADPAKDQDYREMQQQARHTKYEIRGHDLMRLMKPKGVGSSSAHIDGIKALTYLRHAVRPAGRGASTDAPDTFRGDNSPFTDKRSRIFGRRPLNRRGQDEA